MTNSDRPPIHSAADADDYGEPTNSDAARALLVGVLGGLASAAGYLIYRRLPDEHRERLRNQVRSLVESRINEIRSNLKV